MADLTLYGLKNCDTCKKAIKTLEGAGRTVAFIDIRAEADLEAKLPAWLSAAGPEALINTRSTTWRGLSDIEKAQAQRDPAGLLEAYPALIKRPVIERGGSVTVGWSKEVQAEHGL